MSKKTQNDELSTSRSMRTLLISPLHKLLHLTSSFTNHNSALETVFVKRTSSFLPHYSYCFFFNFSRVNYLWLKLIKQNGASLQTPGEYKRRLKQTCIAARKGTGNALLQTSPHPISRIVRKIGSELHQHICVRNSRPAKPR